jgi:hypothetical protein
MTEKQIRSIIKQVFARIDQNARKVVLPTMLGAGLALSGGCDGRGVPADQDATQQNLDGMIGSPDTAYMGPDLTPDPDMARLDAGPNPDVARLDGTIPMPDVAYMGPDIGPMMDGPQPAYIAPDAGPVPPYMAPDGAITPDYMAPDPDGGPQPLYMAP